MTSPSRSTRGPASPQAGPNHFLWAWLTFGQQAIPLAGDLHALRNVGQPQGPDHGQDSLDDGAVVPSSSRSSINALAIFGESNGKRLSQDWAPEAGW